MTLRRTVLSFLILPVAAPALRAAPVVVEGRRFDERMKVLGEDLLLNGTGVRAVAWFKGYAAGLYLRQRTQAVDQAVAMPGAKRLRMQMLQDVPAAEFTKAFEKGVTRNTPPPELPALREGMSRFEALITGVGRVRKGDVVDLDLDPARGLLFSVNGTLRGEPVAGQALYAALLRSFIGDRPYADKLKAGLLGRNA